MTIRCIQQLAHEVKQGRTTQEEVIELYGQDGWDRVSQKLQSDMFEHHLPALGDGPMPLAA